jgi:hypothetical protein
MAANGLIAAVKNGPGLQNRFHVPENMLHLPEFLSGLLQEFPAD